MPHFSRFNTISDRRSWYWSIGGTGKVPFFVSNLVAEIGHVVVAGVPEPFGGVDMVVAFMMVLIEPNAVEDKKLDLGPPVADVGNAAWTLNTSRLSGRHSAGLC